MRCDTGSGWAELIQALESRADLSVFAGAGISARAGVPLGASIVDYLQSEYPDAFEDCEDVAYADAWQQALGGPENRGQRRAEIEKLIGGVPPVNETYVDDYGETGALGAHYQLAALVNDGLFADILTTNFDHLVEIGLKVVCTENHRVYQYDDDIEGGNRRDNTTRVLKLHGDFLFDDLANLSTEMEARLTQNMRTKIHSVLQDQGLVVVGYHGSDETIMELLKMAARSDHGISQGLWWVTYSDSDVPEPVSELVSILRREGKPAHIIGPEEVSTESSFRVPEFAMTDDEVAAHAGPLTDISSLGAHRFFGGLCNVLDVTAPTVPPFGITKERSHLTEALGSMFGSPRQHPEDTYADDKIDTTELPSTKFEDIISERGNQAPVFLWNLTHSEISRLVAYLTEQTENPVFYFDHQFSRNPIQERLIDDLKVFAESVGVATKQLSGIEDILEQLFNEGSTIIIDNPFEPVASDPIDIGVRLDYWDLLVDLMNITTDTDNGKLIITTYLQGDPEIVSSKPKIAHSTVNRSQQRSMAPEAIQPTNTEEITAEIERVTSEELAVLKVMAHLRFAVKPSSLPEDTSDISVKSVLSDLQERDLVIERRGRYRIRATARHILLDRYIDTEETQEIARELAASLRTIGSERPTIHQGHFTIEAEHYAWQANQYQQGIHLLREFSDQLIGGGYPIPVYYALRDYFSVAADDIGVLTSLPRSTALDLFRIYYQAWDLVEGVSGMVCPPYFTEVETKFEKAIDMPFDQLLAGQIASLMGDAETARVQLQQAEANLELSSNAYLLGIVRELLAHLYLQRDSHRLPPATIRDDPQTSIRWLKQAAEAFEHAQRPTRKALCLDNQAAIHIRQSDFEAATTTATEALPAIAHLEGFTADKGKVYANLFTGAVNHARNVENYEEMVDRLRTAEGAFFEAYLNYANISDILGIAKCLNTLLKASVVYREHGYQELMPQPSHVYGWLFEAYTDAPTATSDIVMEGTDFWVHYILGTGNYPYLAAWLPYFDRYIDRLSKQFNEKQALGTRLNYLTYIAQAFSNDALFNTIIPELNLEGTEQTACTCYLEWITNTDVKLKDLEQQYDLHEDIFKLMRHVDENIQQSYGSTVN